MSKPKKPAGPIKPAEIPIKIQLQITISRRVAWLASGFISGGAATETLTHLLRMLHLG